MSSSLSVDRDKDRLGIGIVLILTLAEFGLPLCGDAPSPCCRVRPQARVAAREILRMHRMSRRLRSPLVRVALAGVAAFGAAYVFYEVREAYPGGAKEEALYHCMDQGDRSFSRLSKHDREECYKWLRHLGHEGLD